ncbi:MAG: hypothetical protein AAGC60_20175 [Acidobacteriota bacterium]
MTDGTTRGIDTTEENGGFTWRELGRWSGAVCAHVWATRVPILGLLVMLTLSWLASRGMPTVRNAFITTDWRQLAASAFVCVLAVALLGHALIFSWLLAAARFGFDRRVPLPLVGAGGGSTLRTLSLWTLVAGAVLWPLLSTHYREGPPDGRFVGLSVGVVAGVAVVGVVVWWVRWARQRAESGRRDLLDRALLFLGDGYWDAGKDLAQPGHKLSIALTLVLVGVYGLFYVLFYPEWALWAPPTVAFIIVWLAASCLILAGVAFFADRWRLPLVLILVVWTVGWHGMTERRHEFLVVGYEPPVEEAEAEGIGGEVEAGGETWRRFDARAAQGVLTVVAADGGGIQAAAWAAHVLTGLQSRFGERFTDSVELLSAVSGGGVGVYYYLEAAAAEGLRGPSPTARECVRRAATTSSLEASAWGLIGPDFLRVAVPPLSSAVHDRGWALERAWIRTAERMCRAIERSNGRGCAARFDEELGARVTPEPSTLGTWRRLARDGELPHVVWNATVVDDGTQAFFGTERPEAFGCRSGAACWGLGHLDLQVATAARLSATFPYVTPIARPHLSRISAEHHAEIGRWSLADGGYFDNAGILAAIQWLRGRQDELKGFRHVVFLQIRSFPDKPSKPPDGGEGLVHAIAGPAKALLKVRTAAQATRAQVEVELLEQALLRARGLELDSVLYLELRPPLLDDHDEPLSWHLSERNIEALERQWRIVEEYDLCSLEQVYEGFVGPCPSRPK